VTNKPVLSFALILVSSLSVFATGNESAFDGHWWSSASKEQRTGFIAGYIDCAAYEGGKKQLNNVSWNLLEPKVTSYYEAHGSEMQTPVAGLIEKLGLQEPAPNSSDGEKWPEKHGIFDGEYWRQSLADHRGGFVSGFLACYRVLPKRTANFSKPDSSYVTAISEWYGIRTDDPSEINDKRVNTRIADALFRFKDDVSAKIRTRRHTGLPWFNSRAHTGRLSAAHLSCTARQQNSS
jgi:hypothetical protein